MSGTPIESWSRQVFAPEKATSDVAATVFCGIYGPRWIDNAIQNLERQVAAPAQVVMALNSQDQGIVERLLDFQISSRHEVWIAVNERNLGPAGSFYRNRDLVRAPWTISMHQDDVYLEQHVSVLTEMAARAETDTIGLFTSMGGISEDGQRTMSPPPMVNSHLRGAPSWALVPEIIRRHPFPTPTAAVRSECVVPSMAWYDSGAPDSEWLARLACSGTFDASDEITVLYRQPMDSESSRTDWSTRAWLWSASLNRILSSPEFGFLLQRMPNRERDAFATALLDAIPARYPSSDLFGYLQFLAAQRMCDAWAYRADVPLGFVSSTLATWGPSAATRSLEDLSGRPMATRSSTELSGLLGQAPRRPWLEVKGRDAYRRYAHKLPPRVRTMSLSAYKAMRGGAS